MTKSRGPGQVVGGSPARSSSFRMRTVLGGGGGSILRKTLSIQSALAADGYLRARCRPLARPSQPKANAMTMKPATQASPSQIECKLACPPVLERIGMRMDEFKDEVGVALASYATLLAEALLARHDCASLWTGFPDPALRRFVQVGALPHEIS